MKIKDGYRVRQVAGMNILMPEAEEMDFSNVVTLNDSGLFIWEILSEGCSEEELLIRMLNEFDAPKDVLEADMKEFLDSLEQNGLLDR